MTQDIVTEEDAKTKWCPFTRVALVTSPNRTASMGTGGYADITKETRCLASGCMMWRWIVPPYDNLRTLPPTHVPGTGYCGLSRERRLQR